MSIQARKSTTNKKTAANAVDRALLGQAAREDAEGQPESAEPKSSPRVKAAPVVDAPKVDAKPPVHERLFEYADWDSYYLTLSAIESVNSLASRLYDVLQTAGQRTLEPHERAHHFECASTEAAEAIGALLTMRDGDRNLSELLRDAAKELCDAEAAQ